MGIEDYFRQDPCGGREDGTLVEGKRKQGLVLSLGRCGGWDLRAGGGCEDSLCHAVKSITHLFSCYR